MNTPALLRAKHAAAAVEGIAAVVGIHRTVELSGGVQVRVPVHPVHHSCYQQKQRTCHACWAPGTVPPVPVPVDCGRVCPGSLFEEERRSSEASSLASPYERLDELRPLVSTSL